MMNGHKRLCRNSFRQIPQPAPDSRETPRTVLKTVEVPPPWVRIPLPPLNNPGNCAGFNPLVVRWLEPGSLGDTHVSTACWGVSVDRNVRRRGTSRQDYQACRDRTARRSRITDPLTTGPSWVNPIQYPSMVCPSMLSRRMAEPLWRCFGYCLCLQLSETSPWLISPSIS